MERIYPHRHSSAYWRKTVSRALKERIFGRRVGVMIVGVAVGWLADYQKERFL